MTEKTVTDNRESDGGSIQIDTGFYEIQVWGDPGDDLKDLEELAYRVADRAKRDVVELDDSPPRQGVE